MRKKIVFLTLILMLLPALVVSAAPPVLPASFYGTVRITGLDVPAGAIISAHVGGLVCGTTTVRQDLGYGAVYSLNVRGDDPDTPQIDGGRPGDQITFLLNMGGYTYRLGERANWQSGTNAQLPLNVQVAASLPIIIR